MKFAGIEENSTEGSLAEVGINPYFQAAFLSPLFSVICKTSAYRVALLALSLPAAIFIRFCVARLNGIPRDRMA
jgi:hypothetical protein